MPPVRVLFGFASLTLAALLLKTAIRRLIQGAATMLAGAAAFAVGVVLVGGALWSALRGFRNRRRATRDGTAL